MNPFKASSLSARTLSTLLAGMLLCTTAATAQLRDLDPDWKEIQVPPPPAFQLSQQVPFDILNGSKELRWGLLPTTLSFGADGVIRYVVAATSGSGVANVFYEGINCVRGEVKTYARLGHSGQWSFDEAGEWRGLNSGLPSRHALALARTALCDSNTPRSDVQDILRRLKSGPEGVRRY